ncbi:hypothetical protein EP47_07775 [Legionella norrlandica]|uniref:HTH cro/C1-type domain-containing protein n=2 Tax=Legionella norrlandica TaxID=1498499 RepID=A0A0A2T672_9GAMM|nr:hypothetical protein EP47_07775 [Legionella norrlandica]
MSEINDLFALVKQQLRLQGITYKILADKLQLSEASIKRMFSNEELTLCRLERICSCIDMTLSELFALLEKKKIRIRHLSESQEMELVSELELLLVAICILNHWTFDDILKFYTLSESTLIRYAARLDRMKIIELLPGNRFKHLVDPDFHWIPDGPIQRFFQQTIQSDFFTSHFEKPTELLLVRSGMLSEQDNQLFQQAMIKTANEFVALCRETIDVPIEKRQGTAFVMAIRPWVPQIFDYLKRKD